MKGSILDGKRILAVEDEPDVLTILEEEILQACPNCKIDKATTYQEAVEMLGALTYDLVILDIMGVRGSDLLEKAVTRNFPVASLQFMLSVWKPLNGLSRKRQGHTSPRKNWGRSFHSSKMY
jgi:hypothetical protein